MKAIITEEQYRRVITESIKEDFEKKLEVAYGYGKDIVKDAQEQLGLSFKFLLTYGAGIGSLVSPIVDYLNGQYAGLSESEIHGLAVSAISIVFYNAKDYIKIYNKMKKDGLIDEFSHTISYTQKLKEKVTRILDVLGMSIYTGLDIVAYSFLLPILPALINLLQTPEMDMIALEGLTTSSFITLSAVVLKTIIEKLSDKISNKKTYNHDDEELESPDSETL